MNTVKELIDHVNDKSIPIKVDGNLVVAMVETIETVKLHYVGVGKSGIFILSDSVCPDHDFTNVYLIQPKGRTGHVVELLS